MKKVIFLDLDGVLNSRAYDRERDCTKQTYIDETRLPLLKRIVDETGAKIVFSSSWREHWDKNSANCDEDGVYINECFSKYDLKIFDKTPVIKGADKSDEISYYLEMYLGEIDNYVILDDENFDWTDAMRLHVIKTNAFIGRGLNEEHVRKTVEILNKTKIKYEVVGWTSFLNKNYYDFEGKDYKDVYAARLAIIENIRKNGYAFGGDAHQYAKGCCPILNNGEAFRCSMREWGALMAEAWNAPNDDGYGYMIWYMDDYRVEDRHEKVRDLKYPVSKVDRKKIVRSGGEFDTTIPDSYEPYGTYSKDPEGDRRRYAEFVRTMNVKILPSSDDCTTHPLVIEMTLNDEPFKQIYDGVKTIEVRLNDEKRQRLQVGDIIQFLRKNHPEDHIRTEVVALKKFSSFLELFSSDLLSKTGFYGYTVEEATSKMYDYYDQADEKMYGVLAIEIKVLTK